MFQKGDIVEINNEEYIIVAFLPCNKMNYVYLVTVNSPHKVMFVKQNEQSEIFETVVSEDEKKYILSRFESTP